MAFDYQATPKEHFYLLITETVTKFEKDSLYFWSKTEIV